MRRKKKEKRILEPDIKYKSALVTKFISQVMKHGKKNIARKIVYNALEKIKTQRNNPLETFENAVKNVSPQMEVRSRRIGGANYQVPIPVPPERKIALSMRWLIQVAKNKKGKPMADKLAEEFVLAAKNEGAAIKKRNDTHRMADANKAFAHFAWQR